MVAITRSGKSVGVHANWRWHTTVSRMSDSMVGKLPPWLPSSLCATIHLAASHFQLSRLSVLRVHNAPSYPLVDLRASQAIAIAVECRQSSREHDKCNCTTIGSGVCRITSVLALTPARMAATSSAMLPSGAPKACLQLNCIPVQALGTDPLHITHLHINQPT